jgi:t-SNARE complex subunit (syntaxin)
VGPIISTTKGGISNSKSGDILNQPLISSSMISDNHSSNNTNANGGIKTTNLKTFLSDSEIMRTIILEIKYATDAISNKTHDIQVAVHSDEEKALSTEIQTIIDNTNRKAAITKKLIASLTDDTKQLKDNGSLGQAEIRIRDTMLSTISRKFRDVVSKYQDAQVLFKKHIKSKVTRQIMIAKPDISEEKIDEILASGNADAFTKSAILKGVAEAEDQLKESLGNAKEKYGEMLRLEKSMADLKSMFMDFALIVEEQQELLDQIQTQVELASEHIEQGNEEMVKGIDLLIDTRKKQIIICFGILVIIGIIIGIIYLTRKNDLK